MDNCKIHLIQGITNGALSPPGSVFKKSGTKKSVVKTSKGLNLVHEFWKHCSNSFKAIHYDYHKLENAYFCIFYQFAQLISSTTFLLLVLSYQVKEYFIIFKTNFYSFNLGYTLEAGPLKSENL